jgi:hypothetical protein
MIQQSTRVNKIKPIVFRRASVVCRAKLPQKPQKPQKPDTHATHALNIATAIAIVGASLVLIATAREFNLDLEKSHQEYTKMQHVSRQLSTLREQQIKDEILLNALVEEILKLREIGII